MTEKQTLREKITEKYRSLAYFCKLTGIPYKKTLNFFIVDEENDSETLKDLQILYNVTDVDKLHGLIRDEDRSTIRLCILSNFKNLSAFCREHDEYDTVYISNIIGGRLTDETRKYQNLVKLLTVNYDLDVMIWYRMKNVSKIET